jgi:ATP-dependent Clp protease ATP-binding subunit ClpC
MYERYTEQALNLMRDAQIIAKEWKHDAVGTQHVLLAMLERRSSYPCMLIDKFCKGGSDLVKKDVEDHLSRGLPRALPEELPTSPRLVQASGYAMECARSLDVNRVDEEHVLYGLARAEEGIAYMALSSLGMDHEILHQELLDAQARKAPSRASK